MSIEMITARVPKEIVRAIETYREKHNIDFKTDAIIEMLKLACETDNIDLENLPEIQPETEETDLSLIPSKWECPVTHTKGGLTRCETRLEKHPEKCKECESIPRYYYDILFEKPPEEEEEEEEPEEAEKKTIPTVFTKPNHPYTKFADLKARYCPDLDKQVSLAKCDVCKAKDWNKWKACPKVETKEAFLKALEETETP